jgi:hypothetical protein
MCPKCKCASLLDGGHVVLYGVRFRMFMCPECWKMHTDPALAEFLSTEQIERALESAWRGLGVDRDTIGATAAKVTIKL